MAVSEAAPARGRAPAGEEAPTGGRAPAGEEAPATAQDRAPTAAAGEGEAAPAPTAKRWAPGAPAGEAADDVAVVARVARAGERLSPGERRVAEALVADPSRVAFGTVAELARRARTSGPTVMRLAAKLGFDGYAGLQAAVRSELAHSLRPAAERIRAHPAGSPLARALAAEAANVAATLGGTDPAAFERAVGHLADRSRPVLVLSGDASAGVAATFASDLGLLRPGVDLLGGSEVAVARRLAHAGAAPVVLAIELRRYERWVLAAASAAVAAGATLLAVTDGVLSPLAEAAAEVFVVSAAGAGPFDSHVGTLALANALVAGVAARLRPTAAPRLEAVESAWTEAALLVEP